MECPAPLPTSLLLQLSYVVVQLVPLPPRISGEGLGLFLIAAFLGFSCLFIK